MEEKKDSHLSEAVVQKRCSQKFHKIHRKTPASTTLFIFSQWGQSTVILNYYSIVKKVKLLQYSKIVILSKYYKSYHVCKANRIYSQYIIHFSQLLSLYFSKILKIIFFFLCSTCFIRIFPAGNLFLLLMTYLNRATETKVFD